MFKSRTLLVLGAGASHEVGMPLGTKLMSDIGKRLDMQFGSNGLQETGSHNIADALRSHVWKASGGRDQDIRPYIEAAWAIRDMSQMAKSIDDVIDRRNEARISLCGKLAIAECILSAERASALFIPPPNEQRDQALNHQKLKDTWLYSFINMLIEGVPRHRLGDLFSNISVVSFNYDRCLKHFLTHAIRLQYGLRLDEVQEIVRNLRTIYPYGTISPLDFEDGLGLNFGAKVSGERLLDISSQIRTFTEQSDENEIIPSIKKEIALAQQIIFLGFAFHRQNLDILSVDQLDKKRIIGTTYGVSEPNTKAIRWEVMQALKIKPSPPLEHDVTLEALVCGKLLENYSRTLAG